MKLSKTFLTSVLDSVSAHIAVIDLRGNIVYSNRTWREFADNNGCCLADNWRGVNYLDECRQAVERGDQSALISLNGIKSVVEGSMPSFELEYPCHSPDERHWFMMTAQLLEIATERFVVLSHKEITKRKLAEEEVARLARIDSLTQVANRREFERFLDEELKRCKRLKKPLAMALVDVDYLKAINDTYGHQEGDQCLVQVARVLDSFVRRPSDLSARYGGDEFALVWGDIGQKQALGMAGALVERMRRLRLPNENSPIKPYVTLSVGLATLPADELCSLEHLITRADQLLYQAKSEGRDRFCHLPSYGSFVNPSDTQSSAL